MHPNQPEIQKRYNESMRDRGMTLVKVWIPERDKERFKEFAAELRRQFEEEQQ